MSQPFLYAVEREYSVSIEQLWSAWTDPHQLAIWYHPIDMNSVPSAVASELRIGGLWACAVDVPEFGFVAYFFGQYTVIEELKILEHTLHYTQSVDEFEKKDMSTPSHRILIEFESRGESGWVKFSQFGVLPEGQVDRTKAGMESYFDSLGKYLLSNS